VCFYGSIVVASLTWLVSYGIWLPWCGVLVSISICGVALNPWDSRLMLHCVFANGFFGGGFLFSLMVAWAEDIGVNLPLSLVWPCVGLASSAFKMGVLSDRHTKEA